MNINSIVIRINKSNSQLGFHIVNVFVNIDSRYIGKKEVRFTDCISENDFQDKFHNLLVYAEQQIKDIITEELVAGVVRKKARQIT